MTNFEQSVPAVSVSYKGDGSSTKSNALGMRAMQERAYERRGEQYLLIKSPPASGKSRALMFIALDKLHNQGLKKAIIVVPEKSIGASFRDEPLSKFGFWADWTVEPQWNLCNAPGEDGSKVRSVKSFLESESTTLVCTHATFRFAFDQFATESFDDCVIAIDEFHHVSANPDNVLGNQLKALIERNRTHIVAMTGSYFRGDSEAVLLPEDEAKFETVTYTYYEQLNGYNYLQHLDIGYYFYKQETYLSDILKVLEASEKTILHIPNVNSRESTRRGKIHEVDDILGQLGSWKGTDEETGFQLVETADGKVLRIADLVDPDRQARVQASLRSPRMNEDKDFVDIIIALGMAKEGFDWIWCEHALTVGYRSSLTEIVQIIGRATRDAPNKTHARFTNLIAEPDAEDEKVTDAVNDTLKAIAASLLMEQVLTPRFDFSPKNIDSKAIPGVDYGENGYQEDKANVGIDQKNGKIHIEIKGLAEPKSIEAQRICREDLNEIIAPLLQKKTVVERGLFDDETVPQEITQIEMGKIIQEKFPELSDDDTESVRQHAIAALNVTQQAKRVIVENSGGDNEPKANIAFVTGVQKYVMDVRELDIDLIDSINPFSGAYSILAKTMSEGSLRRVAAIIAAKKTKLSPEDAKDFAIRALQFKTERGRAPSPTAADPWEAKLAEGAKAFMRFKADGRYDS